MAQPDELLKRLTERFAGSMGQGKPAEPRQAYKPRPVDWAAEKERERQIRKQMVPDDLWCEVCWGFGHIIDGGSGRKVPCPDPCPAARHNRMQRLRIFFEQSKYIPQGYRAFSFETWLDRVPPPLQAGKHMMLAFASYMVNNPMREFTALDVIAHYGDLLDIQEYRELPADYQSSDEAAWQDRVEVRYANGKRAVFPNSSGTGVFLTGEKGTGKTGITIAMANIYMDAGYSVAFINFPEYLADIKRTYADGYGDNGEPPLYEITAPVREADVLIVDEFGLPNRAVASPHDIEVAQVHLATPRYNSRKPLIVTTNHSDTSFEQQWGDFVGSRLFSICHVVTVGGKSIRNRNRPIG